MEILERDRFYHIYNRGINGANIFFNDKNKSFFLKRLDEHLKNYISVYAYCLMDNHFHIIIKVNDNAEIVTQSFSNLFNSYAKAFNKQENRTGSLFEKHFKRIKLSDEIYLKNLIIYIHINPNHHLNLDYTKYRFSSYQSIISEKETRLQRTEVLALFGGIENFIFSHDQRADFLTEKYTFE